MAVSYENYHSFGPSDRENPRIEPKYVDSHSSANMYDQGRFHPYTRQRSRYCYEACFASGIYPETFRNLQVPSDAGKSYYLSRAGYHSIAGSHLPNNQQFHYNEIQQTNNQLNYTPKSIQNLCKLTADAGTSQLLQSSSTGKDRRHPFYSRKRVEPAEGMTRTRDKYRVVYTETQRRGLESEYNTNKFITTEIRTKISEKLGLSERQIKIWFQNRRAKERRDGRKEKYTEQTETENSSTEDDNDTNEYSSSSLDYTKDFQTSCRFTGSENVSFDRRQCRFSNQTDTFGINSNNISPSSSCLLDSRSQQDFGTSVSPSEWRMPTGSSFLPTVDISPLAGNVNFELQLRL